jgi:hypothetical protein
MKNIIGETLELVSSLGFSTTQRKQQNKEKYHHW